jgi:uncharacterized protein YydD (DUF2326 family)
MIHRIFSSLQSFKALDLAPGLNILLSEKSPEATQQQTRNRSGKSSLVELIHFVCGANWDGASTFRAPELVEAEFGVKLDVLGEVVEVARSGREPSKIVVQRGETSQWPKQPKEENASARLIIGNTAWREVLGRAFFGLDDGGEIEEGESGAGRPSFRSLFAYFARRENIGGMRDATRNNAMQQTGDSQIAMCYLMGIDWTIAQQWEAVRRKEKQIRELKRIVGQGLLSEVLESSASLRSKLVVADQRLSRIEETLSSFRIHEQYHDLERESSVVTRRIADLTDENEVDRNYLQELEAAMRAETPPAPSDLTRLYEEAGVVLPELVQRRYADVLKFHESVIRNRQSYLEGERVATAGRIQTREAIRGQLDTRRAELMGMLRAYGALDHFTALQAEHGRLKAEAETLRHRFDAASQLEATSAALDRERIRLVERLRQEFEERQSVLDEAIRTFSDIAEDLYGEPGRLEFHATPNGPELRLVIQGDRSRGIGNMEIFCFDMMVQRMCARQRIGPGFLVHDSHLFDGVDPRQTGRALAMGARLADELGFQYLVTLNSDVLSEIPTSFDAQRHLLPRRLTDATVDGGLFGLRFEPPRDDQVDTAPRRRGRSAARSRQG